jgi:Skp family chaperone for outer membrane proteins
MAPTAGLLPMSSTTQPAPVSVPAGLIGATVKAARSVAAGVTTAGVVPATVHLLFKGVLTAMFMTKMRLALLACGLLATGVAVLAQQSGRGPEAEIRLVQAATTKGPETPSDEPDAIDAMVSRDMERLDVEMLRDEVQQLRIDVQNAYRRKTQAERPDYPKNADGSPRDTPKQARSDYEVLRESYQSKLRELTIATQRLETEQSRARAARQKAAEPKPPSKKPSAEKESARSAPNPPAAVIGSIDIDAVFKRWVKAQEATKSHQAAVNVRRGELMKIESEAREEMGMLKKLRPGTVDYKKREDRIAELKAMMEAGREQAQREFTVRESQIMVSLLQEIQETIAAVAKAKGLNYVVKVAPGPKIDADPNEVTTAMGRSVLYADPRNDITEEVIGSLNRRSKPSEAGTSD